MRFTLGFVLLITTVCTSSSYGSTVPPFGTPMLTPEVDAAINSILTSWNTPGGVAVAVVRTDGKGAWQTETKGYGVAKADGTKIGPDTIFSLGSNSKLFDILSTGLLISNASLIPQISWTTKIAEVLPEWKLMDPFASAQSTITDLMSHRTGMPRHDFAYSVSDEVPALTERLQHLKPSTGFRENLQYTNIMYAVLSYLPTALLPDKPPFGRYVKQHLFDPLGMNSTTYSFAIANATGNLAQGFARTGINASDPLALGSGTTRVLPFFMPTAGEDGNIFSGPGGVLSTATDVARWLQMLILFGQHPVTNASIVPAVVIQTVSTGVSVFQGNPTEPEISPVVYGGGQEQYSYQGHDLIEVRFSIRDFDFAGIPRLSMTAMIWVTRLPIDGFGIAVLSNDDTFGALFTEVVKFRIIDALLGLPVVDWNSRYQAVAAASFVTPPMTPAPANATISVPIASLARKYSNIGYGADIELCAVHPSAASPASSACAALVPQLKSNYPGLLANADLVWKWGKIAATYMALTHFDGAVFNVSGWVAIATGNVSAPFWAYDSGLGVSVTAEFDLGQEAVGGFGIRGGLWGSGAGVSDPTGDTVEERSELFYSTV
ncbi:beta-lactamase/transpeptidase-like protein [Mycena filopes]|nr:beta-lactamase/transpeptidase-like protein [Mycena filopes]